MPTLNPVENRPDEPTREEVERLADELQCSDAPIKNQAARMLLELRRQRDEARRLWREELQERRTDVERARAAAEQGERDREDAERFRGLEQFVVGITTRCSDGYEEDYERDEDPDDDGEEFREWIDFMLKNSRANEADAARQPHQEGDR